MGSDVEVRGAERRRDGESGETLLELLITMILMGLAVVAILSGLFAVTRLADYNSKTTHVGSSAQSYAEQLKQPVVLGAVADYTYVPCATVTPASYPDFTGYLPNTSTYTARIVTIEYISILPSGSSGSQPTWSTTCPSTDYGLQRITVEVEVDDGVSNESEQVTLVKRDASCSYSSTYDNLDQGPC